jgi:hypothetical protein
MKFQGFVGQSYHLDNIQYECNRTVNLYPELDEAQTGSDGEIGQLVSTPGKVLANTPIVGQGGVRGLYTTTQGLCFYVVGPTLYQLVGTQVPFSSIAIGTLLTQSGVVNFTDNNGLLVLVDGPNGYSYKNGVFAQIIDPSWQGATNCWTFDEYFLFNVPNTNGFYWSDLNAVTFTLAGGSGVAYKQGNSDPIVNFVVFNRLIWLVGSQTTEVWTDNPGGNTTFQRIPGPYIQHGLLAPNSLAYTEFGALWIAQSPRGGANVVMTNGYGTQRVSTYAVEQALQRYGQSLVNATGFTYQQNGHEFYQINPPDGSSSWVYDITISTGVGKPTWHERTFTDSQGVESRDLADNACVFQGYNLVGDYSTGNIYSLDYNAYTDNGKLITRTRVAPHLTDEYNRIFYNMFTLKCRTGVGLEALSGNNPNR